MPAAALAATVLGVVGAGLVILALATRRGPVDVVGYDDYRRGWRDVHGVEPDRMVGGFLDWYFHLPYALARPLARAGVSADLVTLGGLVVAAVSVPAYLAGGGWLALGGAAVLLSGLGDQIDGAVAVLQRRTTTFGAVWDSAVDRLSDLVLLCGPAAWLLRDVGGSTARWGVAGLAAAGASLFLLEYVRARAQAVGQVGDQVVTPAERPTRVIVAAAAGLVAGVLLAAGGAPRTSAAVWVWSAWGLSALSVVSAGLLLRDVRRRDVPTRPTTAESA